MRRHTEERWHLLAGFINWTLVMAGTRSGHLCCCVALLLMLLLSMVHRVHSGRMTRQLLENGQDQGLPQSVSQLLRNSASLLRSIKNLGQDSVLPIFDKSIEAANSTLATQVLQAVGQQAPHIIGAVSGVVANSGPLAQQGLCNVLCPLRDTEQEVADCRKTYCSANSTSPANQ